jgi:hypothetical protein
VVLCHTLPAEGSGKKALPVSSVFQDSMDEFHSNNNMIAQFSLMDCAHILPSGKTIHEKFKLNLKKRPTIFVSGKVGPPKQVSEKHLKTGHMLTKLLKGMLEPHAAKIASASDFKTKCLNKNICALLLKGGSPPQALKDAVKNLLSSYEDVQFASVDSQTMLLPGLEEHLPEYETGHHRFVVFKKVSGGLDAKDGRLITSIAPLNESISFNNMSTLINNVQNGSTKPKKLSSIPQFKTRSKKLEEAEKAKRERANKKKEAPKQNPSTGSTDNDGSKEGRKAEREKRRAEHRSNNPDYKEMTPEQKAEMERMRRARMEQESQKWNIDGEEEGEAADDDYDGFEDEEDEDIIEDLDGEDEDVLDLD